MNGTARRIVITGLGAVTPLGTGNAAFWQGLAAGKSGVRKLQSFASNGATTQLAAEVIDFDPKRYVKQRKSLKVMARDIQLAVGAAQLTVEDAGLDPTKLDPTRFGVNCGAGLIATELEELGPAVDHSSSSNQEIDLKRWGKEGLEQLFPLWMLKYLPNMPACHISIAYDAQGPNNSITAGEASSTLAMGEAFRILSRGGADLFITGGTDSKIHPLSFVRLELLHRMARRWDGEPERASRPFDADREGMIAGEGAGMLVFEELAHARARGAKKIYGEVLGFGSSCYAADRASAVEKALLRALADAKLQPGDVGHIVANAESCVVEDKEEAKGLARVLGPLAPEIPVVAYKSYFGQLAAGSGAVELIASLLAAEQGQLIPTLNFERPDPDMPRLRILRERSDFPTKPFLLYSVSRGGQCGALAIRPLFH